MLQDVTKTIYKRLFRVYAHIYHSHFKHVCALDEEAHLNTCFKHFIFFTMVRPYACGDSNLGDSACGSRQQGNKEKGILSVLAGSSLC
jgi:hypothetical protein